MLGRTDSRTRAILVLLVFVLVAGSLGVRLAYWQVVRRDELAADAQAQSALRDEIPAQRGAIYDRTGTVVLATSVERDRLAANPSVLTPARRLLVAQTLIAVLGLSGDAATTLRDLMTSDKQYVVLAHDLLPGVSEEIRRLRSGTTPALSGVVLEPEEVRVYPQPGGGPDTSLAAQLLGFVNRDGQGQYGVEQYYQDQLSGLPRVVIAQRDTAGNLIPDTSAVLDPGLPGQDLTLTIDASLQFAVEQELLVDVDRRPRAIRVRGRHRSVHGRGLRLRELPVLRRQRLLVDRVQRSGRVSSIRSRPPSTSPGRCSSC